MFRGITIFKHTYRNNKIVGEKIKCLICLKGIARAMLHENSTDGQETDALILFK